jgi:hypothetical protein
MLKKILVLVPAALVCAIAVTPVSAKTVIIKKGHHHWHHDHDRKVIIKHRD